MILNSLHLTHFRSHKKYQLSFDPTLILLVGPNGAGKTNILESIYVLGRGESWRVGDVSEMVGFGSEVAHLEGEIAERLTGQPYHPTNLHVVLTRGIVGGKRVAKTKFLVDGVARHKADFTSHLRVVLFEPESLEIIIGDPGRRRGFLDEALSQTDNEYARSLGIYAKALRTRNRLLQAIREGKAHQESLEFWEREMVKHGEIIQAKRQEMIEWLDSQVSEIASKGRSFTGPSFRRESLLSVSYDPSPMSEGRLDQYRERELAAGFTLIGPQRDDLGIQIRLEGQQVSRSAGDSDNRKQLSSLLTLQPVSRPTFQPLSSFGSRGQQRMAVLRLKLLEAEWIEKETGDSPVILLDDIFSELDSENEVLVRELIRGRQTVIAATDVRKDITSNALIIDLT